MKRFLWDALSLSVVKGMCHTLARARYTGRETNNRDCETYSGIEPHKVSFLIENLPPKSYLQ